MTKEINPEMRQRIIHAYIQEKKSYTQIAMIFGCHRTTVKRIIDAYNVEGRSTTKIRKSGRPQILTDDHKKSIQKYIDDNCSIPLRAIKQRLEKEHSISPSLSSILRGINSFSYTLKRTSLIPKRRNDANAINDRFLYASKFLQFVSECDGENFIFVDEVGFNVSMRCRRGRSLKGTRAVHIVPTIRSRNISICSAITKNGHFYDEKSTKPFNSESFASFLERLFEKIETFHIINPILILDNVRFHKVLAIRNKCEENGVRILFLPPYSPFLNPIENMFAQWKEYTRQGNVENEDQLFCTINSSLEKISGEHCRNYYTRMMSFIAKCLQKETILDG